MWLLYILSFGSLLISMSFGDDLPLAILHVEGSHGSADVCAQYNPHFSSIPESLKETPKLKVFHPIPSNGCEPYMDIRNAWNSSTFIENDGNCSIYEKLKNGYHAHAKQVILTVDKNYLVDFSKGTPEQHKQIHMEVGVIADSSWDHIQIIGEPMYAQLYHPHDPPFDPNLVVIWIIAMFTVIVGAYWCGKILEKSGGKSIDRNFFDIEWALNTSEKSKSLSEDEPVSTASTNNQQMSDNEFPITTIMVAVFILMICTVLLLLYFFYKYLIYAVIFLFAVASVSGTYECLSGLMSFVNCGRCKVPENNIPILKQRPEIRQILLLLFCIGLSVWWVIIRNKDYAWILQDFLGVCFCINLLKLIRLPNLKISTMLLLALLIYDIFFVFITPFFSARGKSVMVEVATGNGSNEHLPMVIRVPKIIQTASLLCERPYSLLGFGDILLPGLFVAFNHNFDVIAKTKYKVYFIATSVAYGLGLAATFVALILMKIGQPALLYLAPSVLIACLIVGTSRGEIKALWRGQVDFLPSTAATVDENAPKDQNNKNFDDNERRMLLDSPR